MKCEFYTYKELEWIKQCLNKAVDDEKAVYDTFLKSRETAPDDTKHEPHRYYKKIEEGRFKGKLLRIDYGYECNEKNGTVVCLAVTNGMAYHLDEINVWYKSNHPLRMPSRISYPSRKILELNRSISHNGLDARLSDYSHGISITDMLQSVWFNNGICKVLLEAFNENYHSITDDYTFGINSIEFDGILKPFFQKDRSALGPGQPSIIYSLISRQSFKTHTTPIKLNTLYNALDLRLKNWFPEHRCKDL